MQLRLVKMLRDGAGGEPQAQPCVQESPADD
jgi:hypothetical protein